MKFELKNKTIVIIGGGSAGWISAIYLLNKSKDFKLNLNIKLISKGDCIGVGEATTLQFRNFILNDCKLSESEFLSSVGGAIKYAIKFKNWNMDGKHYYHPFIKGTDFDGVDLDFSQNISQNAINNDLSIDHYEIQRKINGVSFDLYENNKIDYDLNSEYAYHFNSRELGRYFKSLCLKYSNFTFVESHARDASYDDKGYIKTILLDDGKEIEGDFFINCIGFGKNIFSEEYFDIEDLSNIIPNNSAISVQCKNKTNEILEPYTSAIAMDHGWIWKIPQYYKTGYGCVYSNKFFDDKDFIYEKIIKENNICEKDILESKSISFFTHYNKKQLHKNCLNLGLSSGFIEPLESTSIHLTILGLNSAFIMLNEGRLYEENNENEFNKELIFDWENAFKFVLYHYFTNPNSKKIKNDYWMHYEQIKNKKIFNFYEKYQHENATFSKVNYLFISLGLGIKDFHNLNSYHMSMNLKNKYRDIFSQKINIDISSSKTHNELLNYYNNLNNKYISNSLMYS